MLSFNIRIYGKLRTDEETLGWHEPFKIASHCRGYFFEAAGHLAFEARMYTEVSFQHNCGEKQLLTNANITQLKPVCE